MKAGIHALFYYRLLTLSYFYYSANLKCAAMVSKTHGLDSSVPSPGKHQGFRAQISSKIAKPLQLLSSPQCILDFFSNLFWVLFLNIIKDSDEFFLFTSSSALAHWDDFKTKFHDVNGLKQRSAECASLCAEHYFFFANT